MSHPLDIYRLFSIPVGVAYHVVCTLATWFAPLPGGMATAAAIVVFTVAVRLALLPLSYYATRGEATRARLLPRVQDLHRRYARQPDRLQRELSRLYQAEGAGLFAGCLPVLLQLPFFSVMYRLFGSGTVGGVRNTLLAHHLFGAALASRWLTRAGPFSQQGMVFLGLFALIGTVAWFAARVARPPTAPAPGSEQGAGKRSGRSAHAQGRVPGGAVGLLARLVPYATLAVAALVPLATGLYLLTTTTWTLLERAVLRRKLAAAGG